MGQPRVLVPVILVMLFNRWNTYVITLPSDFYNGYLSDEFLVDPRGFLILRCLCYFDFWCCSAKHLQASYRTYLDFII
jgi:hypothetical protein